ncbi:head morphogenesis [Citrobacter phage HCF1]|uniref:Uncharacterized protein n=1 Tax=Citrobacter phage HCF1 TaxID=2849700 RepID=A0ABX6D3K7_9CAUD|nr:head morphogenesis [Citrobacter phage HCF1]
MFPDMTERDVTNALNELAVNITENGEDVEAAIAAFMTLVLVLPLAHTNTIRDNLSEWRNRQAGRITDPSFSFPDMTERDVTNALNELAVNITENGEDVEAAIAAFMTLVLVLPLAHTNTIRDNLSEWRNRQAGRITDPSFSNEPWFNSKYATWRELIAASVRKFAYNVLDDWEVQQRLNELQEKAETKRQIQKRLQKYKAWARNRAAGFVGSWYSVLMYQRVVDSGVTHYIWRTQEDNRVRPARSA